MRDCRDDVSCFVRATVVMMFPACVGDCRDDVVCFVRAIVVMMFPACPQLLLRALGVGYFFEIC